MAENTSPNNDISKIEKCNLGGKEIWIRIQEHKNSEGKKPEVKEGNIETSKKNKINENDETKNKDSQIEFSEFRIKYLGDIENVFLFTLPAIDTISISSVEKSTILNIIEDDSKCYIVLSKKIENSKKIRDLKGDEMSSFLKILKNYTTILKYENEKHYLIHISTLKFKGRKIKINYQSGEERINKELVCKGLNIDHLKKEFEINVFDNKKKNKTIFLINSSLFLSIGSIILLALEFFGISILNIENDKFSISIWWLLFVAFGIIFSYLFFDFEKKRRSNEKFNSRRIDEISEELKDEGDELKAYVRKLLSNNIQNIENYYEIVKQQAKKSFVTSIVAMGVGFVIVGVGIFLIYLESTKNLKSNDIIIISGVVVEFISAIFFWLYKRTVTELDNYHDKLIDVQNTMLAIKVASDIKKENRDDIYKDIIGYLLSNKKSKKETKSEEVEISNPKEKSKAKDTEEDKK